MRRLTAVVLAIALVACAPATQRAYVAPTNQTVVSTTEEHQADPPAHLIYVENRSTVDVKVFAITLTDCENVNVQCGVRQMNTRIPADGRQIVVRIEPKNRSLGFHYRFGFSWHADSSGARAALNALATAGDSGSRVRLAAIQHSDSLRNAEEGPRYNELSRSDFTILAPRIVAMRAYPESLVVTPGTRTSIEKIRLLMLDNQGTVLGQTRWIGWRATRGAAEFEPPNMILARRVGRSVIHLNLAPEPEKMLAAPLPDLELPVIVAFPPDPTAPVFEGRALDADGKKPLACVRVALEDSAQNVVARDRSSPQGTFFLTAPRAGTYRVRVETRGWAPVYGPSEVAKEGEEKQHEYVVGFTDQMLTGSREEEFEHARPTVLSMAPTSEPSRPTKKSAAAQPIVSGVTLGGSESMPILGIIGHAPAGTMWTQLVVDSTGHVDIGSVTLPSGTDQRNLTSLTSVLPRLRFAPARDAGKPVCELLRMQVNFQAR